MHTDIKVYITGKINGLPEAEYYANFARAAELLSAHGYVPVNPLDVQAYCTRDGIRSCNSSETFNDGTYRHTWQCYMKGDIIELMGCDAILPLDNASDSKGAKMEMDIARALGLDFLVVGQGVIRWSDDRE